MAVPNSTTKALGRKAAKPNKPYPDFPLFPHATGRWAKKIRGKLYYFGPWDNPQAALSRYLEQRDDLYAGRKPRKTDQGLTVRDMLNRFLTAKQALRDSGEIAPRTFSDYHTSCKITGIEGSGVNVAHDRLGNMTRIPQPGNSAEGFDLVYDAWNRLVEVSRDDGQGGTETVGQYEYTGDNRRVVKDTYAAGQLDASRHFYYSDQWQCLEERTESAGQIAAAADTQYVWGDGYVDNLLLRDRDTDGDPQTGDLGLTGSGLDERLYALHDANYNVTALVGQVETQPGVFDWQVVERYLYTAYGTPTVLAADFLPDADGLSDHDWHYTYTTRRLDPETGLMYYRNRMYHTDLGRFVSRDPIEADRNLYRYVSGRPLSAADPTGLASNAEYDAWISRIIAHRQTHRRPDDVDYYAYYRPVGAPGFYAQIIATTHTIGAFETSSGDNPGFETGISSGTIHIPGATISTVPPHTAVHETVHALDYDQGWYLACLTRPYMLMKAEALAYGATDLSTRGAQYLRNFEDPLYDGTGSTDPAWWEAEWVWTWRDIALVANGDYFVTDGESTEQIMFQRADWEDVETKLGLKFSCSELSSVYEDLIEEEKGIRVCLRCDDPIISPFFK